MASFSDYLENKVLDHLFGKTTFTMPSTVYFELYTAAPSDSGGGTVVSGGSYARASVSNNDTTFPDAVSGSTSNSVAVSFPNATANWGTVVAIGMFDQSTGGNLLLHETLSSSLAVNSGDTPKVDIGDLTISLD